MRYNPLGTTSSIVYAGNLFLGLVGRLKILSGGGSRMADSSQAGSLRRLRIFLCHSSNDKPVVRKLYQQLKASSFDPWLDEEKLLPGQDKDLEIRKTVRKSGARSNGSFTRQRSRVHQVREVPGEPENFA